jgi:HD-GYP domain-containing protein (c-di-GMP phosphodiesterase class II)
MGGRNLVRGLFIAFELLVLAGTITAAVLLARTGEWQPTALVVLVGLLALVGERFSVQVNDEQQSASTIAIVLAVGLLGPTPAAACGVGAMVVASATRGLRPAQWLNNLATFAAVPFAAGLAVHAVVSGVKFASPGQSAHSAILGLIVFGAFGCVLVASFVFIGIDTSIEEGRSLRRQLSDFRPLLPGELAAGALATMLVVAYKSAGLPLLIAAIVVLAIFQHLTVALLRSEERAEQLQARSRQLVGLQLGVLRTLVRALGMRDETTGRHAAAVAAYAAALASDLGLTETERDVVRAAGLLHEIGKFTWPDRVLHAARLDEADLEVVKNYPQEGSILVGALDGYGPVADAILYHHERIDGRGYPAGLIGQEIPLASRILAICSTYDTLTTRANLAPSVGPRDAIDELHAGARNGQFDPDLVDRFVALLGQKGATFGHGSDFETELEFERRVREMAEPTQTSRTTPALGFRRARART